MDRSLSSHALIEKTNLGKSIDDNDGILGRKNVRVGSQEARGVERASKETEETYLIHILDEFRR
jgi:hypothetical protein